MRGEFYTIMGVETGKFADIDPAYPFGPRRKQLVLSGYHHI